MIRVIFLLCSTMFTCAVAMAQSTHWVNERSIGHRYLLDYVPHEPARPLPILQLGYVSPANAPVSNWLTQQMALHGKQLKPSDWLVLPFQLQAGGFTKPVRTLMSASLTEYLASNAGLRLNDPFILSAALGHPREVAWQDAIALADKLQAQHIVAPYVGQIEHAVDPNDLKNTSLHLAVLVMAAERLPDGSWSEPRVSHDLHLPFDHDTPPDRVLTELFPEMAKWLGLTSKSTRPVAARASRQLPAYGQHEFKSPVDHALYLQALATMTPAWMDDFRGNLFAQSLHALAAVKTHPAVQLLRARGYHNIGLTAYAQTLTDNNKDKAVQCYRAYLRANFDAMQSCTSQISNPLQKVVQLLDNSQLAVDLSVDADRYSNQIVAALADLDVSWWPVVQAKLETLDPWTVTPVDWVKTQLDTHFPVQGYDLESLKVNDGFALSQTPMHLTPFIHLRRYQAQYDVQNPTLFNFLQAQAESQLLRAAERIIDLQVIPQRGLAFLEALWPELDGHPGLTYWSARAHQRLAEKTQEPGRGHHLSTAFEHGARAYYWSQDMNAVAGQSLRLIRRTQVHRANDLWSLDYPTTSRVDRADPLAWTLYKPQSFGWYKESVTEFIRKKLPLDPLGDRFQGYPKQPAIMAKAFDSRGDHTNAKLQYQRATREDPNTYPPYEKLAEYEFELGNIQTAYDILAAFPPFQQKVPGEAVTYSNRAYAAGALFFWKGQAEMARTFFAVAADYGSGSGAHIGSQQGLAQIDHNLPVAAELARYRIQRYDSHGAVGDFVGLLAALGYAQPAMEVFYARGINHTSTRTWTSALAAQRAMGWTNDEILTWLKRPDFDAETIMPIRMNHLLRHFLMDRTPPQHARQDILGLAFPWIMLEAGYPQELTSDEQSRYEPISTRVGDAVTLTPSQESMRYGARKQKGTIIMPPFIYFLDVYRHVRSSDFATAGDLIKAHRKNYSLTAGSLDYMLPLYAYVMTKLGQHDDLHAQLEAVGRTYFSIDLANFVQTGLGGQTDTALRHLDLAIAHMPPPQVHPLDPGYQLAEAMLWVYTETGNAVYLQRLLDWARAMQKIAPYDAWAYAIEAVHDDGEAQAAALRKAVLLDANSDLLKSLPDEMVEKARKANEESNPFMPQVVDPVST